MMLMSQARALGYARVSLESENIDNQVLEIQKYAESQGLVLVSVLKDVGVSGSRPAFEREGFSKLIEVSKVLGIRTIVVYDLTRLGRDLFDLVNTYRRLLEDGYTVLFVKHPELNARQDSPVGEALRKALLTMLCIVAELERAFIIERTRAGLERARAQGKKLGRRQVPIPMDKVEEWLKKGLSKKDVYRILIDSGYLRYREKGREKTLSYDRFLKRLLKTTV